MAKTIWTSLYKPQIIAALKEANITGEAYKHILKFEKSVHTASGMYMNGSTWEAVCMSDAYMRAGELLDELNGGGDWGYRSEDPKFLEEWKAYCEVRKFAIDANMGDFLA